MVRSPQEQCRRIAVAFLAIWVVFAFSACGVTGYGASRPQSRLPVYHHVKSGETVQQIARRYGVSSDSILRLNQIVDPRELEAGNTILVGYRSSERSPTRRASAPQKKSSAPHLQTASLRSNEPRNSSAKGFLQWPVESGRMISGFGPRQGSFHDGIDIGCAEGTPVFAAHGGLIVYSGSRLSGYGKLLLLRQDSGLTTVYAHNSRLLVEQGERVRKGQKIAESGSTGHATGPHLHFEVRTRDKRGRYVAVDPLPLLTDGESARPRWRINESLTPILAKLFN